MVLGSDEAALSVQVGARLVVSSVTCTSQELECSLKIKVEKQYSSIPITEDRKHYNPLSNYQKFPGLTTSFQDLPQVPRTYHKFPGLTKLPQVPRTYRISSSQ